MWDPTFTPRNNVVNHWPATHNTQDALRAAHCVLLLFMIHPITCLGYWLPCCRPSAKWNQIGTGFASP